jgi:hypothetical protein
MQRRDSSALVSISIVTHEGVTYIAAHMCAINLEQVLSATILELHLLAV